MNSLAHDHHASAGSRHASTTNSSTGAIGHLGGTARASRPICHSFGGFGNGFHGTIVMVHGACSSAGCYSMTDDLIEEIYALARESLKGGQKKFQIQAFPFRMTPANMVKHRDSKHFKFWTMLKQGYDHFEITRTPPKVNVCERSYQFNTTSKLRYPSSAQCPPREMPLSLASAYTKRMNDHAQQFEKLLARAERRKMEDVAKMRISGNLRTAR